MTTKEGSVITSELKRLWRHVTVGCLAAGALLAAGCQADKPAQPAGGGGMRAMPVQTVSVKLSPVAESSDYVSTIKSRRSATIQPQVNGAITRILVHSGDHVSAGQVMINLDPRQQQATVAAQLATERQKKALYDYNQIELDRQRKLFEAGVTS